MGPWPAHALTVMLKSTRRFPVYWMSRRYFCPFLEKTRKVEALSLNSTSVFGYSESEQREKLIEEKKRMLTSRGSPLVANFIFWDLGALILQMTKGVSEARMKNLTFHRQRKLLGKRTFKFDLLSILQHNCWRNVYHESSWCMHQPDTLPQELTLHLSSGMKGKRRKMATSLVAAHH